MGSLCFKPAKPPVLLDLCDNDEYGTIQSVQPPSPDKDHPTVTNEYILHDDKPPI